MKHFTAQILETQFVDGARVRVQFNGQQIEAQRGKAQCRLVDIKPDDPVDKGWRGSVLVVRAKPLFGLPSFRDKFAKCGQKKAPRSSRWIEHFGCPCAIRAVQGLGKECSGP